MTAMPTNNGLLGGIFGPSPEGGQGGFLSRLNDPRVAMGLAMMGGHGGFGQRMQAGLGALQGAQQRQMQNQLFNLQMQGLHDKQEEREAERKRREQQTSLLYGGMVPMAGPQALSAEAASGGAPGPTQAAAGRMNRTEGLLASMGYGPEDIAMFQAMGPDATMKIISERRFAEPDMTGPMQNAAFLFPDDPDAQRQYVQRVTTMSKAPITNVNLPTNVTETQATLGEIERLRTTGDPQDAAMADRLEINLTFGGKPPESYIKASGAVVRVREGLSGVYTAITSGQADPLNLADRAGLQQMYDQAVLGYAELTNRGANFTESEQALIDSVLGGDPTNVFQRLLQGDKDFLERYRRAGEIIDRESKSLLTRYTRPPQVEHEWPWEGGAAGTSTPPQGPAQALPPGFVME